MNDASTGRIIGDKVKRTECRWIFVVVLFESFDYERFYSHPPTTTVYIFTAACNSDTNTGEGGMIVLD